MYAKTQAYKKIKTLTKRVRVIPGGTSASKTVSILLFLIAKAQCDEQATLTSIVSESFPHLRRGAMRDFLLILKEHEYFKDELWDKTNSIYTFETGSKIEFFSVDQPEKVRGARRDRLFINEANNIPFSAFEELEVRTKEFIFIDFNPTNSFWYYEEVKGKRNDVEELTLTYKDNEALAPEIIASIEQRKERKGWWTVYGLGQLGEVENKIYTDWQIIDDIPHEARLERYGLDFGYTTDPTAIIAVYRYNGGYILDEVEYAKGLLNEQIANIFKNIAPQLIIADSAEPKSIDEIKLFKVNILPCAKGADSRRHGINVVQSERISVTKRSVNLIKEYRNYLWKTDRNGKVVSPNEPEEGDDHCLDATRYAMTSLIPVIRRKEMFDSYVRADRTVKPLNPGR